MRLIPAPEITTKIKINLTVFEYFLLLRLCLVCFSFPAPDMATRDGKSGIDITYNCFFLLFLNLIRVSCSSAFSASDTYFSW